MDIKQLNKISIDRMKKLAPELYIDTIDVSRPFFLLSSLFYKKESEFLSEDYSLTQTELDILASLFFSGSDDFCLTPTELKELLRFTSGGIAKVLKKLESEKYITRIDNQEDKRSKFVQLTEQGKTTVKKALKDIIEFEAKYFSKLDLDEKENLKNLLFKLLS